MENNTSLFNLSITQRLKDDLRTASIWALITSVVAFINVAITLFVNISKGAFFSALFSAAISVLLNIFLLNFARKVKEGIAGDDQELINEGLNDLRLYFKVTGILLIIGLSIAILVIIFAGLAFATR
jgi:hypothetical protein